MKLFFAPRTCSLAAVILAEEAGLPLALEQVDLRTQPRRTVAGANYAALNPSGYVPALDTGDGLLTENAAILLRLADAAPVARLVPAPGEPQRYHVYAWLTFIGTELHKSFSPLFHPEEWGEQAVAFARQRIADRLGRLEAQLAETAFLTGASFGAADAYGFAVLRWTDLFAIDLGPWPGILAWMERIAERPAVQRAIARHEVRASARRDHRVSSPNRADRSSEAR